MSDTASAASEPIAIAEQDALGRADFARRVAQTLVTPDGKWARKLVLGLVGPWGSGKTSVLNLVEQALGQREPKPAVVRFNPWVVSGRDDLLRHLLLDIAAKLDPDNPKAGAKRFLKTAKPYLNALSVAADVHVPGAGGAMRRAVGAAQAALTASPPLAELKGAVEQALRGAGRPVIVFIDDIDRLTDAEVRVIAQIVRAVADFDNVAYLLAYDQQRVEEALGAEALGDIGQKREYGRRYLEKLVNLALRLPQVEHETAAKFLGAAVLAALQDTALRGQPTHARDMKFLIANLVRQVLVTPRDQLRAAQALAVYAGMFGEDVDTADLLAFAALEVRFPALAECIRTTPNWRAMADGRGDHVNRMTETLATHPNGPGRWQFLFPVEGAPVPGEAKSLISWMFPTLFGAENDFSYQLRASRWNGLQGDGRLTALLRGTAAVIEVPAARIRACICNDEAGALDALRAEHKAGTLAQFLDALRRPSSDLPGARIEWLLAMANFLEQTPRHEHGLTWLSIQNVTNLWWRWHQAYPGQAAELRRLANVLLEKLDVHLLPSALYSHAVVHGVSGFPAHADDPSFFVDRDEIESMLTKWVRAMPGAVGWDAWLSRITTPTPILILRETGDWDADARAALRQAIAEPDGKDWSTDIFGFEGLDRNATFHSLV